MLSSSVSDSFEIRRDFLPRRFLHYYSCLPQHCSCSRLGHSTISAVTAFLNAQLHEDIYVTPPDGYRTGNEIWKLNKALYGLKQAGREWWKTLAASLECIDLLSADADSCLWYSLTQDVLLITVVDDFAITGNPKVVEAIIRHLEDSFAMKRMGELKLFVGLEIARDKAATSRGQESSQLLTRAW
jgi:hypothetical protein